MISIEERIAHVRERMAEACRRSGRAEETVRLTAVSKTQPARLVAAAVAAGVDAVGENRVQEAVTKRLAFPPDPPWHLIGPLQQNKARPALETFDVIETIDRTAIADRLELLLAESTRLVPVFIEVNVGGEAQKSGVTPHGTMALVEHVAQCCSHLRVVGLMTVPPYETDPRLSRPHFASLRRLSEQISRDANLPRMELSMGMSDDFEVAIEEGATRVRLGRVIFGERQHTP